MWKYEKNSKNQENSNFLKCENEENFEENIKISANFKKIQIFTKKVEKLADFGENI